MPSISREKRPAGDKRIVLLGNSGRHAQPLPELLPSPIQRVKITPVKIAPVKIIVRRSALLLDLMGRLVPQMRCNMLMRLQEVLDQIGR